MKKTCRAIFLVCLLLLSPVKALAVAPVYPSEELYVSDYATAIFDEHARFMARVSRELYEATGAQVLVVAVESLDGLAPAVYADRIYTGWWNSGQVGADTVFLILSTEDSSLSVTAFGACAEALPEETRQAIATSEAAALREGDFSKATLETYKRILLRLYQYYNLEPDAETAAALESGKSVVSSAETGFYMVIAFVLAMLVVMRGLYLSRKYQRKYGDARPTRRKRFAVTRRAFDERDDNDIKEIDP
jgi:uncharacterized protein